MKVYISASNFYKAVGLATLLSRFLKGKKKLEFVSLWHDTAYNSFPEKRLTDLEKEERAESNLIHLESADVVIMMDDYENVPGGKHFELGCALTLKKKCIVLGRREHLYTRHRLVTNATSLEELVGALNAMLRSK